ncbi:hypothetical protein UFOVP860_91 [uncultured Caudovirales phage]|uniref:Uncharacterized protein n=1 Tax=uncultured Caudovirales phage TaxID=2100421 RepID=A0A6J5RTK7_9CAUD|nr:hypothetical protein UFOVP860_91 [uncultured Caudovirales phage]CAB4195234.1 hypothetical protein UFOVP1293_20 [uncultured Caudovirales phage]CAB4222455.1 hypothetical protein UFOVP1644_38 [uncultured Caudovirales phage]
MMKTPYDAEIAAPVLPISRGSRDAAAVVRLQEWLVTRGYRIWLDPRDAPAIDGDFGLGTQAGVEAFAKDNAIAPLVDERFWLRLTSPMLAASSFRPTARELGAAIVQVAQAHLLQQPREARAIVDGRLVGADNSGPWPRAYLGPSTPAPWCQGFVNRVRDQAAAALGVALEVPSTFGGQYSLWVPNFVAACRSKCKFRTGHDLAAPVPPGSMFFVPGVIGGQASHIHVGIVTEFNGASFKTAEGNTANDGSANGWLALKRDRSTAACDFGVL